MPLYQPEALSGVNFFSADGDRGQGTLFEDFLKDVVAANLWEHVFSGTGAVASSVNVGVNSASKCLGVMQLSTGTTAAGICAILCSTVGTIFGYAHFNLEWRIQLPTLSTAAQEYDAYIGFSDNSGAAGVGLNGVYFWYDRNTSANWRISCISNGTATTTTTSTAVVAGSYIKFGIDVAADASVANFYIDDVNVGNITTNIPTAPPGVTRCGAAIKIEKQAGTTASLMQTDYCLLQYQYTTPR